MSPDHRCWSEQMLQLKNVPLHIIPYIITLLNQIECSRSLVVKMMLLKARVFLPLDS